MSSLWSNRSGGWEAQPLDSPEFSLPNVHFVKFGTGQDAGVALLARTCTHVRINGLPIAGGLHVLQHRDEVLIGRERFYFSAESMPLLSVFQLREGERRPTCPVCRGPIKDGEAMVRCPGCERCFHQIAEAQGRRKTCWTYAATCRFCQHPTSLTGESAWRPEQEEGA